MGVARKFEIIVVLDSQAKGRAWCLEDRTTHPDIQRGRLPCLNLDLGTASVAGQPPTSLFWMLCSAMKAALEETGNVD